MEGLTPRKSDSLDIKLQIFSAEGGDNIGKLRGLRINWTFFVVLLQNYVILNYIRLKNDSIYIFIFSASKNQNEINNLLHHDESCIIGRGSDLAFAVKITLIFRSLEARNEQPNTVYKV